MMPSPPQGAEDGDSSTTPTGERRTWRRGDPWPGCDYCGASERWHLVNYLTPQTIDRQRK